MYVVAGICLEWIRSRHCDSSACVEIARAARRVHMRNSERIDGDCLAFSEDGWTDFLQNLKSDRITYRDGISRP